MSTVMYLGLSLLALLALGKLLTVFFGTVHQTSKKTSAAMRQTGGRLITQLGFAGIILVGLSAPPIAYNVWETDEWRTEVIESTKLNGILMGIDRQYQDRKNFARFLRKNAKALSNQIEQSAGLSATDHCARSVFDAHQMVTQVCIENRRIRFEVTYPKPTDSSKSALGPGTP